MPGYFVCVSTILILPMKIKTVEIAPESSDNIDMKIVSCKFKMSQFPPFTHLPIFTDLSLCARPSFYCCFIY